MSTISQEQEKRICDLLESMELCIGKGTTKSACSVAAINLALDNILTDKIPQCMSKVIGEWIIYIQDSIPDEMRNGNQWKSLLPHAAGTGRDHEKQRLQIIMDWMWANLTHLQLVADKTPCGFIWKEMLETKDAYNAKTANFALKLFAEGFVLNASHEDKEFIGSILDAAQAASWAADAATATTISLHTKDFLAAEAAAMACVTVVDALCKDSDWAHQLYATWEMLDPCGLLKKLIYIS